MRQHFYKIAAVASVTALLTACGTAMPGDPGYSSYPSGPAPYPHQQAAYVEYGRITNIEVLQTTEPGRTSGMGAVVGAVAGGVLGHAIGSGGGRDVATAVGAVGGAVAGNAVEGRNRAGVREVYRVSIRVDSGAHRAYDVDSTASLRVGDRVRIENGQIFRM